MPLVEGGEERSEAKYVSADCADRHAKCMLLWHKKRAASHCSTLKRADSQSNHRNVASSSSSMEITGCAVDTEMVGASVVVVVMVVVVVPRVVDSSRRVVDSSRRVVDVNRRVVEVSRRVVLGSLR